MALKNEVEAVLYSTGRKTTVEEISRLVRAKQEEIVKVLKQLQKEYGERGGALMITGAEGVWKIDVREKHIEMCRNIISEMDLDKSTMETLAMIAYNQPAIQSDIIKRRNNKAYDHIKEIEQLGFISRQRFGRSKKISLTQRFYDYFDVNREEIESLFNKFKKLDEKAESKEQELENLEDERKKAEEEQKKKEKLKKENAVNFEEELNSVDGSKGYEEPKPEPLEWVEEERKKQEEREKKKAEKEARRKEREAKKAEKEAAQLQENLEKTKQEEQDQE
jgi:segregation and condensation protein B